MNVYRFWMDVQKLESMIEILYWAGYTHSWEKWRRKTFENLWVSHTTRLKKMLNYSMKRCSYTFTGMPADIAFDVRHAKAEHDFLNSFHFSRTLLQNPAFNHRFIFIALFSFFAFLSSLLLATTWSRSFSRQSDKQHY